jgi:hypothetical protein
VRRPWRLESHRPTAHARRRQAKAVDSNAVEAGAPLVTDRSDSDLLLRKLRDLATRLDGPRCL